MKRFSIIFFGALAILMASCSKHAQPEPEFEPWVNDLSLPVPIQFGTPDLAQTKALPVDKASDLAGRWLGVFAINNDSGADWKDSGNILLNNASATYTGSENTGSLQFIGSSTSDLISKYYPVKSEVNYTFYGYYVQGTTSLGNSESPTVTNDIYSVDVTFGSLDYLWAKSVATDYTSSGGITYQGYNAKYIREITKGNASANMPKFEFKHITSAVSFIAKGDSEDSSLDKDFEDIQICSVVVNNAVKSAKLCIANKSEISLLPGSVTKDGTFYDVDEVKTANIGMRESKGSTSTWLPDGDNYIPTLAGTTLGQGLFLCPGYKYNITVHYRSNATGSKLTTIEIPETPKLEAGKKYVYTLVFHKSTKVGITVTLGDWTVVEGEGSTITDLN